ncbi:MAG: M28 family peptidase [bacterium]|nr:M28 family peptidase [bacterium]
MRQKIVFFVFFLVISSNLFPQSPVVQQILNASIQDSLVKFVRELSGNTPTIINGTPQTILSRHKLQPGNALAETYIKQKLQSYGMTTTIQSFSTTGKNVLGVQSGTEFPNQKYIICAHYDDMPSGTTAPGADDNASGTAAVIEAARIFSQYDFPFTIIYALWDEEEQGLIGSEYYATQAQNAGDSILGVVNMDMIGYDGNGDGNADVHNSSVANTGKIKDQMLEANILYEINLDLDVVPAEPYSDHQSFLDHGYGAILLIEDDNDFHPNYHTVNDLIQYINQPYLFKMAKLSFATLASFALNLNMDIIHTPIASTSQSTPIITTALIETPLQIGSGNLAPRIYYRTKISGGTFGPFTDVTGVPTESGNYNFTIPSLSLGTIVQYYLAAQDANSNIVKTLPAGGSGFNPPGSTPPLNFFQFYVASQVVALYDEANNINNWTSTSGWNITSAKYVSPPTSFTDSPSGSYSNNVTSSLKYNSQIDLTDVLGATLEFDTQWNIETDWDYGQIQISTNNGSTWTALQGLYTNPGVGSFQPNGQPLYDGSQLSWVHETIDISNYVNQNITIRFYFRSDGSLTFDGWYVDNIKITTYEATSTFQLSVNVNDGWNMVSIPGLHSIDQNVNTWWAFRDPGANVFKYAGGYQPITEVTPSTGYWMKHLGNRTYNTGDEWPSGGIQIVAHDPIAGASGWNMFGGYEIAATAANVTTNPPGLQSGPIYKYAGGYSVAATLEPGYGYWIKLTAAGQIIIPETLAKDGKPVKYFAEDWGKITLTDATGVNYTLYAVKGEVDLSKYDLPPAPPAGMFDIRYESGRIAEDINSSIKTIDMSGVTYPLTVRVEGMDIRLMDESGKMINTNLKSGEDVVISDATLQKLMVSGEMLPTIYSLEQNYPNPFNPSTVIEFSLPEDVTNVKLSIYNALGEKIAELVNTTLQAGKYQYQWNAGSVATGMYIYELRTDNFVSVKKMLLMK